MFFWRPRRRVRYRRRTIITERKAKLSFEDGQIMNLQGQTISVKITDWDSAQSRAKVSGGVLEIKLPTGMGKRERKIRSAKLGRRAITKAMLPSVEKRVRELNDVHFKSQINAVRLKDTSTLWASCSINNSINLDFRLLFAPPHIMDAIIVHELAHTIRRDHSKAFWSLVTNAIPDYKERRKWLRANSYALKPSPKPLNIMESPAITEVIQDESQRTSFRSADEQSFRDKAGAA